MKKERYYSLDVFRGMTVALMILVNNPGSWSHIYGPLKHAPWNGWTPTDLVFPFFLFAVGNALSFVMPRLRASGEKTFLRKVFKRFLLIFIIGLLLNWYPFVKWDGESLVLKAWENVRIMGVLQRIAIAYLFAALIVYYFKNKGAAIISVVILAVYAMICYYNNAGVNEYIFGADFDKAILGESHMYRDGGKYFDPEGLASSLTPIVQVIFGYFVGWYIQWKGKNMAMVRNLLLAGLFLVGVAYLWDIVTPINKKIWTSSYVLLTTGLATTLIAIIIWMIEFRNWRGAWSKFFNAFGKNPLFIFVLSGLLPKTLALFRIADGFKDDGSQKYLTPLGWFYKYVCKPLFSNENNASLLYALVFITFMWLIVWWMDKKKIYIKV